MATLLLGDPSTSVLPINRNILSVSHNEHEYKIVTTWLVDLVAHLLNSACDISRSSLSEDRRRNRRDPQRRACDA